MFAGLLRKLSLPNLIRERKGKGIRLHMRSIRIPGRERLTEHTITRETTVGIGLLDEENISVERMGSHDGSDACSQLLG